MIDEYYTWIIFGYHSYELSFGSGKYVVAMCDGCCQYRVLRMQGYSDLCYTCAMKRGWSHPHTDEWKRNQSIRNTGKKMPPHTHETRRKISAAGQGIPYEEWDGFVSNGEYCEMFDEACRERIRAKYGHKCFICDRPQDQNINKNGKTIKLSVHHVDRNKKQGCDGVLWQLVPLCMHCHPGAHRDPTKSRLEYILANDE